MYPFTTQMHILLSRLPSLQPAVAPDKDDIALGHMLVGVCGEEQVAIPGCLHNFIQPRLIDGQLLHHWTSCCMPLSIFPADDFGCIMQPIASL